MSFDVCARLVQIAAVERLARDGLLRFGGSEPSTYYYSDAEWRQFLADHGLPETTEIAYIDGAGRVVALP